MSNESPPQYELHPRGEDDIFITVIQNEKSFREWAKRMDELDPRFEKFFNGSFQGDLRCPKGLEYMRQGGRLFDEMRNLFGEGTNLLEERIAHNQNEVYDAMKKLSDAELDCIYVSSKLGTTWHGKTELISNYKKDKSSSTNVFPHTIWRAWKHLKGRSA